jgi:hypothetical protein
MEQATGVKPTVHWYVDGTQFCTTVELLMVVIFKGTHPCRGLAEKTAKGGPVTHICLVMVSLPQLLLADERTINVTL